MAKTEIQRLSVDEAKARIRDDTAGMRRLYTQYRDIAQKRIERMSKSEFASTATYMRNASGFAKLKDVKPENFAKAFSELSKFVSAKGSSIKGQEEIRERTIHTLRSQGLDVNRGNYNAVISIFEEARKRKLVYGSDKVVAVADYMLSADDSTKDDIFEHLSDYLDKADELSIPDGNGYETDEMIDMFDDFDDYFDE